MAASFARWWWRIRHAQLSQLMEVLRRDGDIVVVGQPSTAAAAIEAVAQSRPDVVILDLHLTDGQSQHAIEQIMGHTPTPILILSARIDDRHTRLHGRSPRRRRP